MGLGVIAANSTDETAAPLLSLVNAQKSFGAVRAVANASIELFPGEAHGLVGENGAGKSTLVKMLAGVYQPDAGDDHHRGDGGRAHQPRPARDAGIAVIYQEPTLFPDLDVAENIFMGRMLRRSGGRLTARHARPGPCGPAASRRSAGPESPATRGLSIADQQIIEIAKALTLDAQRHRDGRADGRALGRGGRPALPGDRNAARRRGGGAVHHPPPRRGLRHLPADDRDARRVLGADRKLRERPDQRPARPRDGRPRHREAPGGHHRPAR